MSKNLICALRAGVVALVVGALSPQGGRAEPFSPKYSPVLGDLDSSGGLHLEVPLFQLLVGSSISLNIVLQHSLSVNDYQTVASQWILTPLQTCVRAKDLKELVWSRPGGGDVVLRPSHQANLKYQTLWTSRVPKTCSGKTTKYFSYSSRGIDALADERFECVLIIDEGWMLWYRCGNLVSFSSPDGATVEVAAVGGVISSISYNGDALLTALHDEQGRLVKVRAKRSEYDFGPEGMSAFTLLRVNRERVVFTCKYDRNRLLESFQRGPHGAATPVQWRKVDSFARGDSEYETPVVLGAVGCNTYNYHVMGGIVRMIMNSPVAKDVMSFKKRNGVLVPIN